ncbi:unnamed protein product, partial [Porites lobata]
MAQHQELKRKVDVLELPKKHDTPPLVSIEVPKMCDLPNKSEPWNDDWLPVDILLLTVEDCEFLACYAFMKNRFKSYHKDLGIVYFGNVGESEREQLKVALMKCCEGSSGPGSSLIVTKNAVAQLRPKVVYSVGCCESLKPDTVRLGDVVISSKLSTEAFRTPVGKDIGKLLQHSSDGWNPPLKIPNAREVNVHRDGEILCGVGPPSAKLSRVSNSNATAVESEGEGVFVAAHDMKIEWVIVKGVSQFANDLDPPNNLWKSFACTMAASLVFNMLNDPLVFKNWPHFDNNINDNHGEASKELGKIGGRLNVNYSSGNTTKGKLQP